MTQTVNYKLGYELTWEVQRVASMHSKVGRLGRGLGEREEGI